MLIEPFNKTHIITILVMPVFLFFAAYFLLRKKEAEFQRKALLFICTASALLFIPYKIVIARNPGYDFNIFTHLPLHFCSLNLMLFPVVLYTKNKTLTAYQLYFGAILALAAMLMVDYSFRSKPLFDFACLYYFYYHSLLLVFPFLMLLFKMFMPAFKDLRKSALFLIAVVAAAHSINVILRVTGLASEANYCFTYDIKDFIVGT